MRTRRTKRGFSLVEVLVSAAVLGIGVLAAVRLFTSGTDGVAWTKNRSTATNIAIQRLELLGTQGIDQLPACTGPTFCKAGMNELAAPLANAGTYECTQELSEMTSEANPAQPPGKYRVDTVVQPHPDPLRHPEARLVTVSVCWRDGSQVHQAQLNRLFIPDVDE